MERNNESDTNQSYTKHPLVTQFEQEDDSVTATRDEQPRSIVDMRGDIFHVDQPCSCPHLVLKHLGTF
ncbi:hypothetical protein KXD40_002287 [Peronospora effusa]|nr:hypothetical protein KXD40_002287 [Peronospora effusa]